VLQVRIILCALLLVTLCACKANGPAGKTYRCAFSRQGDAPTPWVIDKACLDDPGLTILTLPRDELYRQIESASIAFQIDTYLCSGKAGLEDVEDKLGEILLKRGAEVVGPLLDRLGSASGDYDISRILMLFVVYAWENWEKHKDIRLDKPTARYLVANAQRITDKPLREICLNWLEPLAEQ
jgi:hypothetical protein